MSRFLHPLAASPGRRSCYFVSRAALISRVRICASGGGQCTPGCAGRLEYITALMDRAAVQAT